MFFNLFKRKRKKKCGLQKWEKAFYIDSINKSFPADSNSKKYKAVAGKINIDIVTATDGELVDNEKVERENATKYLYRQLLFAFLYY